MASKERSGKYEKLTDAQRRILKGFFDNGMSSTSSKMSTLIARAAEETSSSMERVKKWIGNERGSLKRKAGASINQDVETPPQKLKFPCSKRGVTSFNVFCGEFFKQDLCKDKRMAEKNALAAKEWKQLTLEEQLSYKEMAKNAKEINVDHLVDDQRKKLIKKARLQLMDQLEFLSDLGCHTALLLLDLSDGEFTGLGSDEGIQFLHSHDDIQIKFRQFMACDKKVQFKIDDVKNLFNQKYSEAVGKTSRVPYLKGDFTVLNMPDGIDFRRPYSYGLKQIQTIMEAKDKIKFVVNLENLSSSSPDLASNSQDDLEGLQQNTITLSNTEALSILEKVTDKSVAEKVLAAANGKIEEEDIDVINLNLTQEERLRLQGSQCLNLFTKDALMSFKQNMAHNQEDGVILPVFNDAPRGDEPFWLFYATSSAKKVAKLNGDESVDGYWLDLMTGEQVDKKYKLLTNHPDRITGKNIIESDAGFLYFSMTLELKKGTTFNMPHHFNDTVTSVLCRKGFI